MEECFVLLQDKISLEDGLVFFLRFEWEMFPDGTHSPIRGFVIDLFSTENQIDDYPEKITLQDVLDYIADKESWAVIGLEMGNIPQNN